MPVTINGSNTPTAGGVTYGDGTQYATTAAGSAGGVLYSAGSSAPAFTAAGTSGQILQSNGASAPSWVAAPGGGSWIYLSTVTASGAATADVESTFDSTYDMYAIVAENVVPATNTATLRARFKISGSYIATSTYRYIGINADDNNPANVWFTGGGSTGSIQLSLGLSSTANYFSSFIVYVPSPSSTSVKSIFSTGFGAVASGYASTINTSALNSGTGPLTGVRFFASAGNLSGTFRLYGIKNS